MLYGVEYHRSYQGQHAIDTKNDLEILATGGFETRMIYKKELLKWCSGLPESLMIPKEQFEWIACTLAIIVLWVCMEYPGAAPLY
jgi:hypothetical protein